MLGEHIRYPQIFLCMLMEWSVFVYINIDNNINLISEYFNSHLEIINKCKNFVSSLSQLPHYQTYKQFMSKRPSYNHFKHF